MAQNNSGCYNPEFSILIMMGMDMEIKNIPKV